MPNKEQPEIHPCTCPVHDVQMILRLSKHGWFYSCPRWPDCDITHSCHQPGTDTPGKPMGLPADKATRVLRHELHLSFDRFWKSNNRFRGERKERRGHAYKWLAKRMGLSKDQCHIGRFTAAQCQQALNICRKAG